MRDCSWSQFCGASKMPGCSMWVLIFMKESPILKCIKQCLRSPCLTQTCCFRYSHGPHIP